MGRVLRFAGGVVVGLMALPILFAVCFAAMLALGLAVDKVTPDRGREIHAAFWTVGADVTRSAGTSVVMHGVDGSMTRQVCREACDDLIDWSTAAQRVEVRRADGGCIVCQQQGLRLPFTAPKRWGLGGHPVQLHEEPWL